MSKTNKQNEVAAIVTEVAARDMSALALKHGNVKSKMIRELHGEGIKTAEITKLMKEVFPKFIYQHARNVLNQPLKKS